jgi:uncharacterized glyoxalase superfamily protein PhnB
MRTANLYPLVTVEHLTACRDFYVGAFGMSVVFEASWVVMLSRSEGQPICLGLMTPNHPSRPPGPEVFAGQGMIVTVEVEDARGARKALGDRGAPIPYELHDEPWGQRRFMTRDPAGTLIDVVEQIEPADGFWDNYLPA